MINWVILLRGINVGGNNILPMKALREIVAKLGFENVATYIQSGNCVCTSNLEDAESIAILIGSAIEKAFDFRPSILVLKLDALKKAIADNPHPEGIENPKFVHIFFLGKEPLNPDIEKLNALKKPSERFSLLESRFYLYAPEGIGRSKLASQAERCLGVPATARNLRSVLKIAELAG